MQPSSASLVVALSLAAAPPAAADSASYPIVPLTSVGLNRTAVKLSPRERSRFPGSHFAFRWNSGDNKTPKWRPQGIAGIATGARKFVAVTWYGREEANYADRGVRISLVDVTDTGNLRYRHILLVDETDKTFANMHAGGLVYRHGSFHVPDTRGGKRRVHVFPADQIKAVPAADRGSFFNYAYIINRSSSYDVPVKPSFLSFDWDRDQVLVGEFHKCSNRHQDTPGCLLNAANRLAWYSIGSVGSDSPSCAPFFSEMQGAASASTSAGNVLWVASSYGRNNESHLHIANFTPGTCYEPGRGPTHYRVLSYPPGLEDIHVSLSSENIWMLTEFGPHEGASNNRVVFATRRSKLLP